MMTLTLDLPEELASRLAMLLPEEERDRFAVAAIAEALAARQRSDAQLAASLLADLDPDKDPESEAAECISIVEEGLEDVDAGRNLISFEEACRRWEADKATR